MQPINTLECIPVENLVVRATGHRQKGDRLVQICATRLQESFELTYSFEQDSGLANLRVSLPASNPVVPSISSVYWCAFLYENEMHDLFNIQVEGMAVDFKGALYTTSVKYAFNSAPALPKAKPGPKAPPPPARTEAAQAPTTPQP